MTAIERNILLNLKGWENMTSEQLRFKVSVIVALLKGIQEKEVIGALMKSIKETESK